MGVGADNRIYAAIDLKSFYASVECIELSRSTGETYDPLTTNLVVADESRTDKTICLAVTPALKSFGVPGRPRLFEVKQIVANANSKRKSKLHGSDFIAKSHDFISLNSDPRLEIDFLVMPPRMAHYMKYSTMIYEIYLRYVSADDVHVYSIDEVFIDLTSYLGPRGQSPQEMVSEMIRAVVSETGITATAGIGTNLYLAKIAMDIVAKRAKPDASGARMAFLDEISYRKLLWDHEPITDFWRVGGGYAKKLAAQGLYTMGDVARCSIGSDEEYYNQELLYKLFGVNAELLIDHAWGYEPCTIDQIKSYEPESRSIAQGQVLTEPCDFERTRLITREMLEMLSLDLLGKKLLCDQVVLTVGYDIVNLTEDSKSDYKGEVVIDRYGRRIPKHAHGTANMGEYTSSVHLITDKTLRLFDEIVDASLMTRRINLSANHLIREDELVKIDKKSSRQLSIFDDFLAKTDSSSEDDAPIYISESDSGGNKKEHESLETHLSNTDKERIVQEAVISIKEKYGKNAILRGSSLLDGATAKDRNDQIGGHKA